MAYRLPPFLMEDNLMGEQQSKKRSVKSDARKRAGSQREFDPMPASGPAAGASGRRPPDRAGEDEVLHARQTTDVGNISLLSILNLRRVAISSFAIRPFLQETKIDRVHFQRRVCLLENVFRPPRMHFRHQQSSLYYRIRINP